MSSKEKPEALHECKHCHATLTPEESGQSVNVSGLVKCKICGHAGPLRLRVSTQENTCSSDGEAES